MIKYDNIWSQAEPEALQLKRSGYTPQQVCTALAKKYFGDTEKYNTVKGWHTRKFPEEWPSAENKGGIKQDRKPKHNVYPQLEFQSGIAYQQHTGLSLQNASAVPVSQHPQDNLKCTHNSYIGQASPTVIDPWYPQNGLQHQDRYDAPQLSSAVAVNACYPEQIRDPQPGIFTSSQALSKELALQYQPGEPFPELDLAEDPTGIENVEHTGSLNGDFTSWFDDQQLEIQDDEMAKQPGLAFHGQNSHALQNAHYQRVPRDPDPFAIVSRNFKAYPPSNLQQHDCSFEGPHDTEQPLAKHCGINPLGGKPSPPPQHPLPPIPVTKIRVIHKGYNESSWRPICVKESKVTKIDPNVFPTDHRRKRLKGHEGREFRDSIALRQLQHNTSNLEPQGISASVNVQNNTDAPTMTQIDSTPNPTVNSNDRTSKVSIRSDCRDSGYASIFDSAVDSMRSSFSSFNLAEDVNFQTDCKEADDGFVDVKVKAKWRMRRSHLEKMSRSYLEKLRDESLNDLSSEDLTV